MVWPDGAQYLGMWNFGKAQGKGKFVHVEGDVYEGDWYHDKANGFGTYHHVNGAIYCVSLLFMLRVTGEMTCKTDKAKRNG